MQRPHDAGADTRTPAAGAGPVLIADNDRAVSSLLTEVLVRSGLRVVNAYDGDEASAMVGDPSIRVIVCDLDMPGASGLEVLESLNTRPSPPDAVVVSGYLDADVRARLARLPFVRKVLGKPFDLLAFAAFVRSLHSGAAPTAAGEAAAPPC
jgi:CheY-like chemotaxis protein